MTLCWRMSRPVDVTTVSIKAVRNDIPSNHNSNSTHVFLSFPPSQRSPQRHTSLVSHQTSHRISGAFALQHHNPFDYFFSSPERQNFSFQKEFPPVRAFSFPHPHITRKRRVAPHVIRTCASSTCGPTFPAGPQRHVGKCLLPHNCALCLHGLKTTTPGRESPIQNQTLRHFTLQQHFVCSFS